MAIRIMELDKDLVISTTLENLVKGGVITEQEKHNYRCILDTMEPTELLLTLLESHAINEQVKAMQNKMN